MRTLSLLCALALLSGCNYPQETGEIWSKPFADLKDGGGAPSEGEGEGVAEGEGEGVAEGEGEGAAECPWRESGVCLADRPGVCCGHQNAVFGVCARQCVSQCGGVGCSVCVAGCDDLDGASLPCKVEVNRLYGCWNDNDCRPNDIECAVSHCCDEIGGAFAPQ